MARLRYLWGRGASEWSVWHRVLTGLLVLGAILLAGLALGPMVVGEGMTQQVGGQSIDPSAWTPSYSRDVEPIFGRACVQCHGPERADKGLRLDGYQRMMAGDSYGTVVIPGDSSRSAIITILEGGTMPHGAAKLSPAELETITRWIDAGARPN